MATEKRLIDANALIENLKLLAKHENGAQQSAILGVVHTISCTPTVDAVEVVHGRWLTAEEYANQGNNGWLYCSECEQPMREFYGWGYCPNCGAKMDEEGRFVGICRHCAYRDDCEWPKLHPKTKLKECPDFNKGDKK